MSRTSRIPFHQNVYDLLQIAMQPRPDALGAIREWEERTGYRFPTAMAEWYASEGDVWRGDGAQAWRVSLVDLWSEYSNNEQAHSLDELCGPNNRPEQEWRAPNGYYPNAYPEPFFRLIGENQDNWTLYALADGSSDPPVFVTDGEYGPWLDFGREIDRGAGWRAIGTFSEILFLWFASYYIDADFVPISFNSQTALHHREGPAPPKLFRNGLWLRTPVEPFQPPIIDFLTDQFGESERTPRPGDVTTYTFRPDGGTIRVTADEPALTGGLSAWWVQAETGEQLAEFARLLRPWGTLRDNLRADTDPAREVLQRIRGA